MLAPGVVPDVLLRTPDNTEDVVADLEVGKRHPLPLTRVMCGPTGSDDQASVVSAVERLLRANGLGHVPVELLHGPLSLWLDSIRDLEIFAGPR